MKMLSVFIKTLKETRRDWLALVLTLSFAPFFVVIYWLFFSGGSTSYSVLLLNQDKVVLQSDGTSFSASALIEPALATITYPNGTPFLKVQKVTDRDEAITRMRNREAVALLILPEDFSASLLAVSRGDVTRKVEITVSGDLTNPYYPLGMMMITAALEPLVGMTTGVESPLSISEEALGGSGARSEFETYVPGTIVFAVILLVFLASMVVAREVESGALRRLKLTRMSAFDLLGGITLVLMICGALSAGLALGTAVLLGFTSQGSMWLALAVSTLSGLSVIGVGLLVACACKTVTQAFLISNFPLGFFMFFSGSMFPIPKIVLGVVGGHSIGLFDFLPSTHAVVALNKIMTLGAGLGDILFELTALSVLSVLYFLLGVWLFSRTHLRAS